MDLTSSGASWLPKPIAPGADQDASTTTIDLAQAAAATCSGVRRLAQHPGRVQEEFIIELPRPRDLNSVELTTYANRITHALKSGAQ